MGKYAKQSTEEKNMKFKFQLHEGTVSFFTWIKLYCCVVRLLAIRFLRFCKRILTYLKKYIVILVCVALFEIILIPLGISMGKYTSWTDGVWDLRVFFLTSIIISVVGGILHEENIRHKELIKQFNIYKNFMFESESFISSICSLLNIECNENVFMNEQQHKNFLFHTYSKIGDSEGQPIKNLKDFHDVIDPHFICSTPQINPITYLIILFNRYLREIDLLIQQIHIISFIGDCEQACEQLDYVYKDIWAELINIESNPEKYTEIQLLKFAESVSRAIYPAIASCRRPWRWDIFINNTMDKLLIKHTSGKDEFISNEHDIFSI